MAEKPKGWFSHKHQDNAAHVTAREKYQKEHGQIGRREKAQARAAKRDESRVFYGEPEDAMRQLARLNQRLGQDMGAQKERARLMKLLNPKKENKEN